MNVDEALSAVAAGRREDPLRPVSFVVPTRLASLALRRELALRQPFAGVRFETLPRLGELAGAGTLAREGRRPLARPIGDYAAKAVARQSRGALAEVADLPGYARVLRRHFQRLRRGGIRRAAEVRVGGASETIDEFLRTFDAFRDLTRAFYDEEDLFDAAEGAVRAGHSGVAAEIGDLFVVPPGPRTAGSARFLAALGESALGAVQLDDTARPSSRPAFVLMPDPSSEADEVARMVLRLLEGGASVHEVAVFHGADPAYQPMLASALGRAGVPVTRSPGRPLVETLAGKAVLALARLPALDYSRVAVMDFLALTQSRRELPAESGSVYVRPTAWDRISREAGVTHGANRWGEALSAAIEEFQEHAESVEDVDWRANIERDIATARELEGVIRELIARLEPLRNDQPAAAFIRTLRGLVNDYIRPDSPALEEVREEIEQLGTVAAIGGSFNLAEFLLAFEANLRIATVREGSFGSGVLIADYRAAAGLQFEHAIVCGAYEGVFPAGTHPEAILDDRWWSSMRAGHPFIEDAGLRLEREKAAVDRCLAVARGLLTISAPAAGPGGVHDRYPAPAMTRLASEVEGSPVTASALRSTVLAGSRRLISPLASLSKGPLLDGPEFELRSALVAAREPREHRRAGRLAGAGALREARRAPRLSEWDGLIDLGEPLLRPDRQLSATSLEDYGTCGFRFFLRSILGLRAPEEPEERETMDAGQRGTMVHKVLRRFFEAEKARGRPRHGEAWTDEDTGTLLEMLERELSRVQARGQAGLPVYHAHEAAVLRADLVRFLKEDSLLRAELGSVPWAFEWKFDNVPIGDRLFRGSVDRIDTTADGRAVVIDYKTGKSDGYELKEDAPFDEGRKLQLAIYASALAEREGLQADGRYWFITQRGEFDSATYSHSAANAARFGDVLDAVVGGIEGGVFPAVPGEETYWGGFKNCGYCDFDRICSRRRIADFESRSSHGSTAGWRRVAEAAAGDSGD